MKTAHVGSLSLLGLALPPICNEELIVVREFFSFNFLRVCQPDLVSQSN